MRQNYYVIEESQCLRCGACERVCPHGAVATTDRAEGGSAPAMTVRPGEFVIDQARCRHCGMCFRTCPAGAIARPYDLYRLSEGFAPGPSK